MNSVKCMQKDESSYHELKQLFLAQKAKIIEKKKRRKLENCFTREKERWKPRVLYDVFCSMRERGI